jgi:acyl-coenzyme A thioesterase PaaI-like protein
VCPLSAASETGRGHDRAVTPPRDEPPLAALRRRVADRAPLAPIHASVHAELLAIEPGHVEARMPTAARDPALEAVLVLADFVLGLAVTGTVGPGERITTLRLSVQMVGEAGAGELRGTGRLEHRDDAVGVSSAEIVDEEGQLVARCTGRNAVLADRAPDSLSEDLRWAARPGPWALLMPMRDAEPTPEGATVIAHPDPQTANSAGVVQGGALAGVAAHASERKAAPVACWLAARAGVEPAVARERAHQLAFPA